MYSPEILWAVELGLVGGQDGEDAAHGRDSEESGGTEAAKVEERQGGARGGDTASDEEGHGGEEKDRAGKCSNVSRMAGISMA